MTDTTEFKLTIRTNDDDYRGGRDVELIVTATQLRNPQLLVRLLEPSIYHLLTSVQEQEQGQTQRSDRSES